MDSSFPIFRDGCSRIQGYSFVYSRDNKQYFIISDVYCPGGEVYFQDISEFKNSTDLPSLPKCQEKCTKCNEDLFKDLCSECNTEKNYHRINPKYLSQNPMSNNDYFDNHYFIRSALIFLFICILGI